MTHAYDETWLIHMWHDSSIFHRTHSHVSSIFHRTHSHVHESTHWHCCQHRDNRITRSFTRPCCEYIGLFYEYTGLFCEYTGLFCGYTRLFTSIATFSLRHTQSKYKLQDTARHCNIMQYTATQCNTIQHTAKYCNMLQHSHCNTPKASLSRMRAHHYHIQYVHNINIRSLNSKRT